MKERKHRPDEGQETAPVKLACEFNSRQLQQTRVMRHHQHTAATKVILFREKTEKHMSTQSHNLGNLDKQTALIATAGRGVDSSLRNLGSRFDYICSRCTTKWSQVRLFSFKTTPLALEFRIWDSPCESRSEMYVEMWRCGDLVGSVLYILGDVRRYCQVRPVRTMVYLSR